jgi:hypothetical protein
MSLFQSGYSAGATKEESNLTPEESGNNEFMAGYFLAQAFDNWQEARAACLKLFNQEREKAAAEIESLVSNRKERSSRSLSI